MFTETSIRFILD